jgi:predicted transcriptional regulator
MIETMQKAVLMSIRPKWASLILSGEKTVEVRKSFPPMVYLPFRVYLYETMAPAEIPWMDEDGHIIFKGRGMVIGEFLCDEIYDICWADAGGYYYIRPGEDHDLRETMLKYDEMRSYLGDQDGYGWHVSELRVYERPKPLTQFRRPCRNELYCESCGMYNAHRGRCGNAALQLKRPPQSWCYVAEKEDAANGQET